MGLENEKPKHLYRIVRPNGLRFDDTGRLLPHSNETFLKKFFYKGSIPMVTVEDLEFIDIHG
jgi:hypothetical protein